MSFSQIVFRNNICGALGWTLNFLFWSIFKMCPLAKPLLLALINFILGKIYNFWQKFNPEIGFYQILSGSWAIMLIYILTNILFKAFGQISQNCSKLNQLISSKAKPNHAMYNQNNPLHTIITKCLKTNPHN